MNFVVGAAPFQFHKGAIGAFTISQAKAAVKCFNSIKVRLEYLKTLSFRGVVPYFNSIKVRLESQHLKGMTLW